jgi:hypothetical protein
MLRTSVIAIKNVTSSIIREMYNLYEQYYAGVDFITFKNDLSEKNYVLILHSDEAEIKGFSTLEIIQFDIEGLAARALFSGDTIIHHSHWGTQALSTAWCHLAGELKAEHPEMPLYWFLIVKGHRTYRYLPVFSHQFYPNYKMKTPASMQSIMDYLSHKKFAEAYQKELGTVCFKSSRGHLKEQWAEISPRHLKNPNVKYFMQLNPRYDQGEELVCLTELSEDNMRFIAKSMFQSGFQKTKSLITSTIE